MKMLRSGEENAGKYEQKVAIISVITTISI